jgi:hypothetical protein
MESKQAIPPSELDSDIRKPREKKTDERSESADESTPLASNASYVTLNDILRELKDQRPQSSRFLVVSNNPLIVGVVGILIGGVLTAFYTYQQKVLEYKLDTQKQERTHLLTFSDEVNKLRMQKIGEVWERLDQDEFTIDAIMQDSKFERPTKPPDSKNTKRAIQITKLIHDDQAMVGRYRFWLGEELFNKTENYLDINIKYSLNELGALSDGASNVFKEPRNNARQDILQVRSLFLEGEPRGHLKTRSSP